MAKTIADNLQTIIDIKQNIKTAIKNKGVEVADSDSFTTYADKIESIETGGELESITITENGRYTPSEGIDGYNEVTVSVSNPVESWELFEGVKFQQSKCKQFPVIDCKNITDASGLFYVNSYLEDIQLINTQNVENFSTAFYQCSKLTSFPQIDTSKVKDFRQMFWQCSKLSSVPQFDFSSATNLSGLFGSCSALKSYGKFPLDLQNATDISGMFYGTGLLMLPTLRNTENITNAGIVAGDFYKGVFGRTQITSVYDFSLPNATTVQAMFAECKQLITVNTLSFPSTTNVSYLFYENANLESIEKIEGDKFTNLSQAFRGCRKLKKIPQINTSNATDVSYMCYNADLIESIPLLDFGKVSTIGYFFGTLTNSKLTDLGGFKNLKINWNDSYGLAMLLNLTYESVMNVINNLYDFRGNGDTTTTRTIKFNANSKTLLSDEDIAVATNKGWIIS